MSLSLSTPVHAIHSFRVELSFSSAGEFKASIEQGPVTWQPVCLTPAV